MSEYVDVLVPSPRAFEAPSVGRRSTKTAAHKRRLLELLRAPPSDYDGSNKKLAGYMGMSVRQVIRVLNLLKAEGSVKTKTSVSRRPEGGVYTRRMIQIRRENV